MSTKYTFDTNILSYYMRGNTSIANRLNKELSKGNRFIINPITYYEVIRGLLAVDSKRKLKKFRNLCQMFGVLELSNEVLDIAAQNYAILKKKGQLIEDADLFIAAVCLVNEMVLITNNEKHFPLIKGLRIENWIEEN